MKIDAPLIAYLEELSSLTLTDAERLRLSGDLESILGYMERLGELDTTSVPERSHPFDNVNAFRDDEAAPSYDRRLILKNAPDKNGDAFVAPQTVE